VTLDGFMVGPNRELFEFCSPYEDQDFERYCISTSSAFGGSVFSI
jgi:hypothetical protein